MACCPSVKENAMFMGMNVDLICTRLIPFALVNLTRHTSSFVKVSIEVSRIDELEETLSFCGQRRPIIPSFKQKERERERRSSFFLL